MDTIYSMFNRISHIGTGFAVLLLCTAGCSLFKSGQIKQTRIVPVNFGMTTPVEKFKAGYSKPYAHIIWGDDIRNGAICRITITNVTKGVTVYRRDFIHDKDIQHDDFNYEKGGIVELDPNWYKQIGNYQMELHIDGRSKSSFLFSILP